MNESRVIGVDLGGTMVRAGIVSSFGIEHLESRKINARGSQEEIVGQIFSLIKELDPSSFSGIGIGVPGLVDLRDGIVYDVVNIPSWKRVPLKQLLEDAFQVPVFVNNDANSFALAEAHFGKGRMFNDFIGLIIGTGLAGGIIIGGNLYVGRNCGAGEFGMMPYLDHYYEFYASGQYFHHFHATNGKEAAKRFHQGDAQAKEMWREFGGHLGRAIQAIQLSYDPEAIILGGSIGQAFSIYSEWVLEQLQQFPFQHSIPNIRIEVSQLEHAGVLGAAALSWGKDWDGFL